MKSDIPFLGTPIGYAVNSAVMLVGYLSILCGEPMSRPRLLECLLALIVGIPAGIIIGRAWIRFLQEAAAVVADSPSGRRTSYLLDFTPIGAHVKFGLTMLSVWALGMVCIHMALAMLSTPPAEPAGLSARLLDDALWLSSGRVFIPYFLTWLETLSVVGLMWYFSLE